MSDDVFPSMGCEARLVVDGGDPAPVRAFLAAFERRLTRFDAASELSALNASPLAEVPASLLLRRTVAAGLWAADHSGGLVDPTLLGPLRAVGYAGHYRPSGLTLAEALREAPRRAPAAPDPAARWRRVAVDDRARVIRRPPGVEIDSGGVGKGLAADLAVRLLARADRYAVDCGGDLRVGGPAALQRPFDVRVRHPLTGEVAFELQMTAGGIATSGLDVRLWRDSAGRPAHHLIDPSTGQPAWTGVIGATALAPTTLEAETLAKTAVLSGPARAMRVLSGHGGLFVREDGEVVPVGSLRPRPLVQIPREVLAT